MAHAKAISCFEKAMVFNNSYAVSNRGYMYHQGLGLSDSKNLGEATRLYQKAVELGNPLAMNNLALLYKQQGGSDNIAKAIALYQQAIELGHAGAMSNLAMLVNNKVVQPILPTRL